jgi:hypothetical protein
MVVGQADGDNAEPKRNPHLAPLAWMIGEWKGKELTPEGKLKFTVTNEVKWVLDNQAIQIDVLQDMAGGTPDVSGVVFIYWDSATEKIREHAVWSNGHILEGEIAELKDTGHLWEQRVVYKTGDQGHYRHTVTHDPDAKTLTRTFTKFSGSGDSSGPHKFHRVEEQ